MSKTPLSKTLVIAVREYLAAVKTKGFLIGLVLMPLIMGGGIAIQTLTKDIARPGARSCAVLDRTPGETLWAALDAAARQSNAANPDGTAAPRITLEHVPPPATAADLDAARLAVCDRVRRGELTAFVEAGPAALRPPTTRPMTTRPTTTASAVSPATPETAADDTAVSYTTNRPAAVELREFVRRAVQSPLLAARVGQPQSVVDSVLKSGGDVLAPRGLAVRTPGGGVTFEPRSSEVAALTVPLAMVIVMFMVVLIGASPLTTNIIEEKQLRIAEVLVGSVPPFTLMLGKLLGGVATSLTLGAIYVAGATVAAGRFGMLQAVTPGLVAWFVTFTVVSSLMYGALFVVAGAAATNVKEAQSLMTPLMLVVVMPLFLLGPLTAEPHGTLGRAATFFPMTAPTVTMLRLASPPGIAWWQPVLALLSSGLVTVALVWVAGRVFRAGFLLVGRPAKFGELIGWILRG